MVRIKSKNPNRTDDKQNGYDYMEGKIIVAFIESGRYYDYTYHYTGNNIQESLENRRTALKQAKETYRVLNPLFEKAFVFYF